MGDDPIRAPQFGKRNHHVQRLMMEETVSTLQGLFPGAVVTLLLTYPENFPGLREKVPGARTNYISSGEREDMAKAMRELLERWETPHA